MDDLKGPVVKEFQAAASEYCQVVEQTGNLQAGEVFAKLQQALPKVYLKAALLPKPKYCYDNEPKKFVKDDQYARIHGTLQQKIELFIGITRMPPGTKPSELEVLSFTLAEYFTDIYQELKDFGTLYEVGIPQAINDAVWFCRTSFEQQLGIKLTDGLKLLHQLIFKQGINGFRAMQGDDYSDAEEGENPWFADDQEEIYGEDE
jgi:hypothetical protein